MNLKLAKIILSDINRSKNKTLAARVASRWLIADIATEYDILLRLQLLEGALGLPINSLARKSKLGLTQAAKLLESHKVKPEWLDPKNTGLYKALENALESEIRKFHVTEFNANDLINEAASGLGITGNEVGAHKINEVGKFHKDDILSGKATPKSLGLGPLLKFLKQALESKQKNTHEFKFEKNDETGKMERRVMRTRGTEDYDPLDKIESPAKMQADLVEIIEDPHNSLGRKIREFMRHLWKNGREYRVMEPWLDLLEKGQPVKSLTEIANKVDLGLQTTINNWNNAWKAFFSAFWKNNSLLKEIEAYFLKQGLIWDSKKIQHSIPKELRVAYLNPKFLR